MNIRQIIRLLPATILMIVQAGAHAAHPANAVAERERELSLVTLNLYHDEAQWPKRLPLILAELKRLRPDAIALQEVLQDEALPNQAQTLADALGYRYVFASVDPLGQTRRYGNAILTRHPIVAQDWKRLEPFDDSRTALLLRIAIDERPINVYTTHLHWTEEGGAIRKRQVAGLLDFIAATHGDTPSIVMGDFNAEANAPELHALLREYAEAYGTLHAEPATDRRTRSTLNLAYYPPKHIDQVFLKRGAWAPTEARIILDHADAEGVWPSDHYGVHVRARPIPMDAGHVTARGIAFTAIGQEPGWRVEIGHGDSPSLHAELDYGQRTIDILRTQGISTTPGFGGKMADGTDVVLRMRREPCRDAMSGEPFEASASLTVGAKAYEGCGAWLGD